MSLNYVKSNKNIANLLTKLLTRDLVISILRRIGLKLLNLEDPLMNVFYS